MKDFPSIGVVGAGATGGYLAACFAAAGLDVTLVARGATLDAVRRDGLRIEGPGERTIVARPARVVAEGDDTPTVDLVIFCVKSYDTVDAARQATPLLRQDSYILCTQNGVENEAVLAQRFGPSRIIPGVLYIGAERVGPAVIRCSALPRLVLGEPGADPAFSLRIESAARHAGLDCVIDKSIVASKWQKFLFNCALNPITALTRRKLGNILTQPEGQELFEALLDESLAVARAHGAPLREDARTQVMATAQRMNISSSMAEDLIAGRRIELGAFSGLVCKLGDQYSIPTPTTRAIHHLLAVLDGQRQQGQRTQ